MRKPLLCCGRMESLMNMKKIFKALITTLSAVSAFSLSVLTAFAADDNTSGTQTQSMAPMMVSLVLVFVLMYFLMIRPQKKKEKEAKSMQENILIGDEIVTIGGIVGLVVRKGDDNIVIETGGEKNKMRIKLWAISENTSALERAKEASQNKAQSTGLAAGKLKEEKKSKKNDSEEQE